MSTCVFCKIASGIKSSQKFIYENDSFFSVYDLDQKIKGHALVISKKHFSNVLDMPQSLGDEFLDAVKKTADIAMKNQKALGFNILSNIGSVAGQVVFHAHFHILPRKKDDKVNPYENM